MACKQRSGSARVNPDVGIRPKVHRQVDTVIQLGVIQLGSRKRERESVAILYGQFIRSFLVSDFWVRIWRIWESNCHCSYLIKQPTLTPEA